MRNLVLSGFLVTLVVTPVMAFEATTDLVVRSLYASQQVTSSVSNNKIVKEAADDAASFIASNGKIRSVQIEAAFREIRQRNPHLQATDLELAEAILAQ